jgi:hypothetical protein
MTDDLDVNIVRYIVAAVSPVLGGFAPEIQAAVLGELVSLWLAGHVGPGADEIREELLQGHVQLVRDLIPQTEKQILSRMQTQGSA